MTRARGLAGFASAISGPVNSTDVFVGVLTATSMTVNGSASIGGTVTYEDVSNVDSVGIITAQAGIRVTGGSVGIGTSSPAGSLNVKTSVAAASTLTYDSANILNLDYGAVQVAAGIDPASPFGGYLQARDTTNSARTLNLNPAGGNVGIGTLNPLRQFTVDSGGAGATGGILIKNGLYSSNQDVPYLIAGTADRFTGGTANWGEYGFQHRLKSNSNGTPRVTIDTYNGEHFSVDNGGFVAIGTDTAKVRLHVYQPVDGAFDNSCILSRGADPAFQFRVNNGSNSNSTGQAVTRFGIYYDGTGWDQYFQFERGNGAQDGNTRFYNSNGTYNTMVLYSTGYIGCPARLAGGSTGGLSANTAGTIIRTTSDGTLKENVTPIGSQYETVKALNPVTYTWIDTDFMGDQTELGFIAQDVQPHIPEVISTNGDGKLSLDYQKLTATLTKALQEAIAKIETLETKVAALEGN